MPKIYLFSIIIFFLSCNTKKQEKPAAATEVAAVSIDSITRIQKAEEKEKARVQFSESDAIDTLCKYAQYKDIPFIDNYSVSILQFNSNTKF